MQSRGRLFVMRECEWRYTLKNLDKPKTHMHNILERDTEHTLLEAIKKGSVFGFLGNFYWLWLWFNYFLECDVESPKEMIEDHKQKGFLFPPIIRRMKLDERHMSPFMQERYIEENKKPNGQTVVQVCKQNNSNLMRSLDLPW